MHDTHLVEVLRVDIDFDGLPSGPRDSADAQACLGAFMRETALEILDAVFDAALPTDEVWRIERIDLDLGRIVVDAAQDWRDQWARAFRQRLQRLVEQLRDAPVDAAGDRETRHPMHRRQSELETLLFFVRHGRLPWYGRSRRADDPRELARQVLRHRPRELVAAVRDGGDRARLLHRFAAQFDDDWLADLVRAVLHTEPTAAARVLEAVRRGRRPGRADDAESATRLWAAALEHAFSVGAPAQRSDVAVTRLQLEMALESRAGALTPDDALLGTAPAWRRLLHEDRAWLKKTLQRVGRSQVLERRLARTLAADLLPELAGLWLASDQTAAVTGWISAAAARTTLSKQLEGEVRRDLWEAALSHFLSGGAEAGFDDRRFARKVLRRVPRAARPDEHRVVALPPDWRRPGQAWWALLRADAPALRSAVRQHVGQGESACRQLAREWSADMLLEAACLQAPQSRPLIVAAVSSPPLDAATSESRWASTLHHVYTREGSGGLDERAYLACLARGVARAQGGSLSQAIARWNAAVQSADAAPAWFDRVAAMRTHEAPDGTQAPRVAATAAAAAPAAPARAEHGPVAEARLDARTPAEVPAAASPAAGPRSFAGRLVAALATLAGTLGRHATRLLAPPWAAPSRPADPDPVDSASPMGIDNAGLVLIGPYLPRLFDAVGLLAQDEFRDDAARERALHLMQYAIDGLDEPAPESRLVLNKVLSGLDPAACVGRRARLGKDDCALVDGLLEAVIAHWSILGRTSIAGLRETFLQRRGQLQRRPDGSGWALVVEPGSFDILIDRLPWGYAMQKHPWMNEVLHVEWR